MRFEKSICALLLSSVLLAGCGSAGSAGEAAKAVEPEKVESTAVLPAETLDEESSQESVPETAPEPPVPETIDESWFDDALFIGDSITGMLSSHTLLNGGLGEALVIYANSYSCHNAVEDGVLLSYQGERLSMPELVEKSGAGKIFFLLSMNDLSRTPEQVVDCWETVLEDIRSRCPETRIFIQSGTPLFTETGYMTNESVELLNQALKEFCLDNDCVYVDIAQGLKDDEGKMKAEFSLDYAHFNSKGCEVWIDALMDRENYTYASQSGSGEETA